MGLDEINENLAKEGREKWKKETFPEKVEPGQ